MSIAISAAGSVRVSAITVSCLAPESHALKQREKPLAFLAHKLITEDSVLFEGNGYHF